VNQGGKKLEKVPLRSRARELTLIQSQKASPQTMTDTEVSIAFTKYYMSRAAQEFPEDLDRIRGADDFKGNALPLLVNALQQGTLVFSIEEQRRIMTAGVVKDRKLADA
jgi:ribosome assembly protein 3